MRYSVSKHWRATRGATKAIPTIPAIPTILATSLLASWGLAHADANIWEDKEQFVRLESQEDESTRANDHPVELSDSEITAALQSLQANFPKEDSAQQIFTRAEAEILGDALSRGLAQAGSRQDVIFASIGTHSLGGFLRKRRVNTGRVFYQDGKLNVIFGEVLGNYRKKNIYGQRDQDFKTREYGQRSKSVEHQWRIIPSSGLALHQNGGMERDDWLLIDTAMASVSQPQKPSHETASRVKNAPPPQEPSPTSEATPAPAQAVEEQVMPQPAELMPAGKQPGTGEAPAQSDATGEPPSDFASRLQLLKELKDKGLISDDAYEQKMREILSDL